MSSESALDKEMRELKELRDHPSVKDAYDQIFKIKEMMEGEMSETERKIRDARPHWERSFNDLVEGAETTNTELRAAWDTYFLMKALIKK